MTGHTTRSPPRGPPEAGATAAPAAVVRVRRDETARLTGSLGMAGCSAAKAARTASNS
jgi:hypothetical protein